MHIEVPHSCGRTHRGYQSLAECTWSDAFYVVGDGPFALLAHCDMFTVTLYETVLEARRRKRRLDEQSCGKTCEGAHELAALVDVDDEPGFGADVSLLPESATEWLQSST